MESIRTKPYVQRKMQVNQGDVWLLKTLFHEGEKEKPVVIASNNSYNMSEDYVYVVPMTFDNKEMDNTMFLTCATGIESIVICCNVKRVEKTRLSKYIGEITHQELISMKDCLSSFFCIDTIKETQTTEDNCNKENSSSEAQEEIRTLAGRVDTLTSERDFWKQQYDELLTKILDRIQ